jgi:tripartite-type tricarboxylate transporter receptor subunit TctC
LHAFAPHDAGNPGHGLCPDAPKLGSGTVAANNPAQRSVHALAPAGTPKDIVDRYNAVFNEILAQPGIRAVLDKQGLIAQGGPPERLAELIAKDRLRWAKVVKDAEISSE